MVAYTPVYGMPYPTATDSISAIPAQLQAALQGIESTIQSLYPTLIPGVGAGWQPFPFAAGWSHPAAFSPSRFCKVGSRVYVEAYPICAAAQGGSALVGTLPLGYRPAGQIPMPTVTNSGGTLFPQLLGIAADGKITIGSSVGAGSAIPMRFDFATN